MQGDTSKSPAQQAHLVELALRRVARDMDNAHKDMAMTLIPQITFLALKLAQTQEHRDDDIVGIYNGGQPGVAPWVKAYSQLLADYTRLITTYASMLDECITKQTLSADKRELRAMIGAYSIKAKAKKASGGEHDG